MNHSRYVEWQTPSYGGFSLDKLGVIEYLNGYFVVHTVLIIALVRGQETSVVSSANISMFNWGLNTKLHFKELDGQGMLTR
ncbi:hypothetical protein QYZ44_28000 [Vibrio parahaemolyticus]|nr:hypothetical protein [Vibrio parahaemolyticus]